MKSKPQQQGAAPIQDNPEYLYVPGHVFFCEYVQVPSSIPDEELEDFAEVTIGSLSPFPIEHIAWGWYKDPLQPWMLLYSATFESLAKSGFRNLEEYRHVFPSFVSTLALQFEEPTIYFAYDPQTQTLTLHIHPGDQTQTRNPDLDDDDDDDDFDEDVLDDDDLAALGFGREKNIKLPVVYSVHVPSPDLDGDDDDEEEEDGLVDLDELDDGDELLDSVEDASTVPTVPQYGHIAVARDSLLDQVPNQSDYDIQDNWLEFASSHRLKDRVFQFKNNWADIGGPQPGPETVLDREQVWHTDIRSLEFKVGERDRRQKDRRLILALKIAALFVIILFGLEFGAVFGDKKAVGMGQQIAQNAPNVATIQAKNELMLKINNIATNNLMPFEMLQILNNHRPLPLYFTEVEASNGNVMRMKGSANKSDEVNDYNELLIAAPDITDSEIVYLKRVGGKLTFLIEVNFLPFSVPQFINPDPIPQVDPAPTDEGGAEEGNGDNPPGNANAGSPPPNPPSPLNLPTPPGGKPAGAPPALPPGLKP